MKRDMLYLAVGWQGRIQKRREKKMGKKIGTIVREDDQFAYERRLVDRAGMTKPVEYELAIPKSIESFISKYGKDELLRMAIATLKTESDDRIAESGKPLTAIDLLKRKVKTMDEETARRYLAILEGKEEKDESKEEKTHPKKK
jgi:hypothetical protein